MKLLFINSLKGLRKKKIQMLAIIFMVLLSTGIYTSMSLALDRLEDRYYKYLDSQNVEHISFDSYVDYINDVKVEDVDELLNYNLTLEEQNILINYKCILDKNYCGTYFDYNESFVNSVKNIFEKYEYDILIEERKIDSIKDKYDFSYELNRSKIFQNKDTFIKVIPYSSETKINIPYLIEGKLPTNDNEITMLPNFANKNNIKINSQYKIGNKQYKVVGFTYAPDYIYPLVSFSSPIYEETKNNIIYANINTYNKINGIEEKTYSLVFNNDNNRKFEINVNDKDTSTNMFKDEEETLYMGMNTILRIARIGSLQLEFAGDRLFAKYFLYLLLTISVFIIVIITKKRIDDEKIQIGVLKSLGYNRFSIATSYLVYPVIGSIIGGFLGYLLGLFLHYPLCKMYLSYFLVPLSNFKFDISYLIECILIPLIFLSLLCYLVALFMLRKKPLYLLKEGSNLKVNFFSKIANKITSTFSFKYKFKYSFAFRSISKLLIIMITSFGAGMLIVLTLIGSNLMSSLVDSTFKGIDYKYSVSTNITDKYYDNNSEYSLSYKTNIIKINDKKVDSEEITLTGIDSNSKYIKVYSLEEKNIISKIKDNEIIISKNMAEQLKISENDLLTFNLNNKNVVLKVIDISSEYMSLSLYIDRLYLSNLLGYNDRVYNNIMSNSNRYNNLNKLNKEELDNITNVIGVNELRSNIESQISKYNSSIYIVIIFASIMALIIIGVIANIIVEENKKTISLMKVMGYKNSEISSIVLNIYVPVIIISYLISIPAMIKLLEKIVSLLSNDMKMTIPISLSPQLAVIGLIGLLIAYYIAINLSRKVLNRVPLAVALKRE